MNFGVLWNLKISAWVEPRYNTCKCYFSLIKVVFSPQKLIFIITLINWSVHHLTCISPSQDFKTIPRRCAILLSWSLISATFLCIENKWTFKKIIEQKLTWYTWFHVLNPWTLKLHKADASKISIAAEGRCSPWRGSSQSSCDTSLKIYQTQETLYTHLGR